MKSQNKRSIVAIDLFCGAGGLTCGLRQAGVVVAAGIDTEELCRHAYEFNNKGVKFIASDVSTITAKQLNSIWGSAQLRLLAGCAPCQPFSTYNQGKSPEKDDRYPLLHEFSRLIRETKPEFVTMENVPNVATKAIFARFVQSLRAQGYKCSSKVIKCEEYGVPQRRRRLVLLASRIGPAPQLGSPSDSISTVRDALSSLMPVIAGETIETDQLHRSASLRPINLKRIRSSKPGGTWKDWPKKLRLRCHTKESGAGYTPVYGRMTWDDPSPTITTQCYNYGSGRFGHPDQDRAISMREAALLQGFPQNYQFEPPGKQFAIRDLARMIGNAVPVGLGVAIGRALHLTSNQQSNAA